MWIDVDVKFKDGDHFRQLINTKHILSIAWIEQMFILIAPNVAPFRIDCLTEENAKVIYNGFLIAFQGQEVLFDEWGFIKPLLNDRREELHKYMLYIKTINDLTTEVG